MSSNALVTTRINESIKKEASVVLEAIGLTISDAVRLLLTKVAEEHALPFDVLTPNKKTIKAIKEAREKKLKTFNTIQELMVDLNAED